jgi:iron complex outermembrane receptor protein
LNGNYDFDLNNFLGFPSTDEMYNYAFKSHFGGLMSNYTYIKKSTKWVTGVHGNLYNRQHLGSELTLGELYQNKGFKNEFSAFSKYQNMLWGAVQIFADVQYRYTEFSYDGTAEFEKMNWNFINPKAGLSWSPISNAYTMYYSVGSAGREPTRNDIFGGADDLGVDDIGTPLLVITNPERVIDHELGFRFRSRKFRMQVNGYFMNFNNEIVLNGQFGPNGLALNSSVDQSIRTGVELSFVYLPHPSLKLVNNSSFNHSKIQQQTEEFTPILTPALIINQEVIYSRNNFQTGLTYRYQSSSFIDFANENSVESYHLLNLRISYKIKKFQLALLLNNLTNTRYFNNGYVDYDGTNKYFIQAPLNFQGRVTYTF